MNLSNYKGLGVINRTPNSFSDKGLSLNPDHFQEQIKSFLDDPQLIIDIGFESTAPMNSAISEETEKERFMDFLPLTKDLDFSHRYISFDTYKVKNFKFMAEKFRELHPKSHLIFNDVSGVLDVELSDFLKKVKDKDFYYIYTFTHIPSRDQTLDHMKFQKADEDIIVETARAFINAYNWFKQFQMEDQLIFDPGFGFSKSHEQNWRLIHSYNLLEEKIDESHPHIKNTILIGLSKKSFLRKSLPEGFSEKELEELHVKCISRIKKMAKRLVIFRVHDPKVLS